MKLQLANRGSVTAPKRRSGSVGEVVSAFESDTIGVFVRTAPVHEHIILYVISGMIILGILLMSVAKLDKVVTSVEGVLTTTVGSLYVSPFDTGIVRKINVSVGQVVRKGQSLATLGPTFTQADLVQLKQHIGSDQAQIAREEAELARVPYVFSPTDPYQSIQGVLWEKRQAQVKADLANYDGQIRAAESQMRQAESDVEKYQRRLKLSEDTEHVYQPLLDKGYVSKLQLMQATDSRTEMSRLLADAEAQATQFRESAAALRAQRDSYMQQFYTATSNQLVTDRNDRDTTQDALDKAQKLQDLTSLDAPEDAVVLKIAKVSTGAVASGGGTTSMPNQEPLFTLVPLNAPLEAEVHIASADNSFIRVGDPAQLKFEAYSYIRHGLAKGSVKTISEGSFTVDDNGTVVPPYFKARVAISEVHLRDVPADFKLIPGMTVTTDIMVGRRTMLSYLVEGALRNSKEAMREPE